MPLLQYVKRVLFLAFLTAGVSACGKTAFSSKKDAPAKSANTEDARPTDSDSASNTVKSQDGGASTTAPAATPLPTPAAPLAAAATLPFQLRYLPNQSATIGTNAAAVTACQKHLSTAPLVVHTTEGVAFEFVVAADDTAVTVAFRSICGFTDTVAGQATTHTIAFTTWTTPATTVFYGLSAANNASGWQHTASLKAGRYTVYVVSQTNSRESNATSSNDDYILGDITVSADKKITAKAVDWTDGTEPLTAVP